MLGQQGGVLLCRLFSFRQSVIKLRSGLFGRKAPEGRAQPSCTDRQLVAQMPSRCRSFHGLASPSAPSDWYLMRALASSESMVTAEWTSHSMGKPSSFNRSFQRRSHASCCRAASSWSRPSCCSSSLWTGISRFKREIWDAASRARCVSFWASDNQAIRIAVVTDRGAE